MYSSKHIILHQMQVRQQRKTTALTNHKRRYSWRRVSDGILHIANSWRYLNRRRVIFAIGLELGFIIYALADSFPSNCL